MQDGILYIRLLGLKVKTTSEKLFEEFCDKRRIKYQRIEEGESKTPDYELSLSEISAIAEVKEIERNPAEKESDRLLQERGYGEVLSNVPGDRVRSKIRKASPQIKKRTNGVKPGILVLYDGGHAHDHLDPYNIRVAMEGLEQVHFSVPHDPKESPYATGMSHGPKRKMTETANTSISAIAVMYVGEGNETKIVLYHNKYAVIPLKPALLDGYQMAQYYLNNGPYGCTSEWVKYEP